MKLNIALHLIPYIFLSLRFRQITAGHVAKVRSERGFYK